MKYFRVPAEGYIDWAELFGFPPTPRQHISYRNKLSPPATNAGPRRSGEASARKRHEASRTT